MKYQKLDQLITNLSNAIILENAKRNEGKETKIEKKLQQIYRKVENYYLDYRRFLDEIKIDNALTDEIGVLLTDEKGNYKYSKDLLKKMLNEIKELGEKEFDYEPINVVNPAGLEEFTFLNGWLTGVEFITEEEL
jgi:hypothetical protein